MLTCTADVLLYFTELTAFDRMELVCQLLRTFNPFEVRFFYSLLEAHVEDRSDALKHAEFQANHFVKRDKGNLDHPCRNVSLTEKTDRANCLATLALLQANNRTVAHLLLFPVLSSVSEEQMKEDCPEREELLLLLTMAANHPAFSVRQRCELRKKLRTFRNTFETQTQEEVHSSSSGTVISSAEVESDEVREEEVGKENLLEVSAAVIPERIDVPCAHLHQHRGYEFVFEVTWSDGTISCIKRSFSSLVDFHNTLLTVCPEAFSNDGKGPCFPYLSAKKGAFPKNSKVQAEKRFPEVEEYAKKLVQLPHDILASPLVTDFLCPNRSACSFENRALARSIFTDSLYAPLSDSTEEISILGRPPVCGAVSSNPHSRSSSPNNCMRFEQCLLGRNANGTGLVRGPLVGSVPITGQTAYGAHQQRVHPVAAVNYMSPLSVGGTPLPQHAVNSGAVPLRQPNPTASLTSLQYNGPACVASLHSNCCSAGLMLSNSTGVGGLSLDANTTGGVQLQQQCTGADSHSTHVPDADGVHTSPISRSRSNSEVSNRSDEASSVTPSHVDAPLCGAVHSDGVWNGSLGAHRCDGMLATTCTAALKHRTPAAALHHPQPHSAGLGSQGNFFSPLMSSVYGLHRPFAQTGQPQYQPVYAAMVPPPRPPQLNQHVMQLQMHQQQLPQQLQRVHLADERCHDQAQYRIPAGIDRRHQKKPLTERRPRWKQPEQTNGWYSSGRTYQRVLATNGLQTDQEIAGHLELNHIGAESENLENGKLVSNADEAVPHSSQSLVSSPSSVSVLSDCDGGQSSLNGCVYSTSQKDVPTVLMTASGVDARPLLEQMGINVSGACQAETCLNRNSGSLAGVYEESQCSSSPVVRCHDLDILKDQNGFIEPDSPVGCGSASDLGPGGVCVLPGLGEWLKMLHLNQYASQLGHLSFQELLAVTPDILIQLGVLEDDHVRLMSYIQWMRLSGCERWSLPTARCVKELPSECLQNGKRRVSSDRALEHVLNGENYSKHNGVDFSADDSLNGLEQSENGSNRVGEMGMGVNKSNSDSTKSTCRPRPQCSVSSDDTERDMSVHTLRGSQGQLNRMEIPTCHSQSSDFRWRGCKVSRGSSAVRSNGHSSAQDSKPSEMVTSSNHRQSVGKSTDQEPRSHNAASHCKGALWRNGKPLASESETLKAKNPPVRPRSTGQSLSSTGREAGLHKGNGRLRECINGESTALPTTFETKQYQKRNNFLTKSKESRIPSSQRTASSSAKGSSDCMLSIRRTMSNS